MGSNDVCMEAGRDEQGVSAENELLLTLLLLFPLPLFPPPDFCACIIEDLDLDDEGLPSSNAVFRMRP